MRIEMAEKLCACGCGKLLVIKPYHKYKKPLRFISGHNSRLEHPMNSKKHSPESREKMSRSAHGRHWSAKTREKFIQTRTGKSHKAGYKFSEEVCKKMSASKMGVKFSDMHKKSLSLMAKKRAQNPEWYRIWKQSVQMKPNKAETFIMELLNSLYPGQWKYTGDFSLVINGKCPDFVNCNGQKKIIELWGDYWHRGQNPQDRIDTFKPFGYDTLVIWGHELKDMVMVAEKIRLFEQKKSES